MKINSKQKGARGEREFAQLLRDHGFEARRGQQYCGANGDADVICDSLPQFHFEVKRTETLNLKKAILQSQADCGKKMQENLNRIGVHSTIVPVVMHRYSGGKWMAIIEANEFLKMVNKKENL